MDYLTNPIPFPFSLPLIGVAGIAGKSVQSCFVPFRELRESLNLFDDEELVTDQAFWIDEELLSLNDQAEVEFDEVFYE